MNLLSCFLSKNYWFGTFFAVQTIIAFLSSLGFFWLITEISVFINNEWQKNFQELWRYFILISAILMFWQRRPIDSVSVMLGNPEIQITILVGDIFHTKSDIIISTNTTFDTKINDDLISYNSLQGKFTNIYYNNCEEFDRDLGVALQSEDVIETRQSNVGGKTDKYKIGTVAKIRTRGNSNNLTAYLLAMSDINADGVANSNIENVKQSITSLWAFISTKGSHRSLAIPIIGTGHGRIVTPRSEVIKIIVRSFLAACSESRFTDRLTIVISHHDYNRYDIDLFELKRFLECVCRYTERESINVGTGAPIN